MKTYRVGILGATGAVGQKFIRLLQDHPWFDIAALAASERSAGKSYEEAAHWVESIEMPKKVASMKVVACDPKQMPELDFVFSGLDSSVATEIEGAFAAAGIPVISNAKNYRTHANVPLLVPEVNPDHCEMIKKQTFDPKGKGFIVTNPNCVVVPMAMALRPLYDAFGISSLVVTSLQSVSGAGYPGVPSLDILGNVVPFISGEEEKIAVEPLKLLGTLNASLTVDEASFGVAATATRVPTIEGHMVSMMVKFEKQGVTLDEVEAAFTEWKSPLADLNLPFAPEEPLKLYKENRFPQPRLHSYLDKGQRTSIGRLRKVDVMDVGFVALAHNTIRGAAGGAILNAELLVVKGYL